jgi:four helix bundle protein
MSDSDSIESFRDLVVWQVAMDAAETVFELVEGEALRKRFWLCDQICPAVSSISANLAEGHGSGTRRMYVKHCYIARGSLCESLSFVDLIRRRQLGDPQLIAKLDQQLNRAHKLLNGLIAALAGGKTQSVAPKPTTQNLEPPFRI